MSASKEEDESNVIMDGLLNAASTKAWKPINGAPSKEAMEAAYLLLAENDERERRPEEVAEVLDAFAAQRVAEAVAAEREACAQAALKYGKAKPWLTNRAYNYASQDIAEAISARCKP